MLGFSPLSSVPISTVPSSAIPASYTLNASAGSYTLTGQSATLTKSKVLSATSGSYTITGISASITKNNALNADAGSFALTGKAATFSYVAPGRYVLTAEYGSYALTGNDASFSYVPVVKQVAGGLPVRRQRIVLEVDGKEYRLFADELEAFLASLKQNVQEAPQPKKRKKKKIKISEVLNQEIDLPKIRVVSAPVDIIPQLSAQIARTNVVLANIMSQAMQRYAEDIDDEEVILMLL